MTTPDFTTFGLTVKSVPRHRGWFRGPIVEDWEEAKKLATRLRASPAAQAFHVLVGSRENDEGHRIYVIPPLVVSELVEAFSVGGEEGGEPMVVRVGERLTAVEQICPFVVTFADSKGLHAEFTQSLDEAAATRIEACWSEEDAFHDGLESYISDYEGEGPLMVPRLVAEQGLQLWWD